MYEIPQKLEYNEKIVFGLTFGQLMYVLIFLPFVLIFFRLPINLVARIILISIPVSLATGFMFFDLLTLIKNWYGWFKLKEIKTREELDKIFGIKEIKNNFIVNSKGKRIVILRVNTINFSIKPQTEQEAIISSF